ncbi:MULTISPECIES: hypothetical protein [Vibrio]|uniref:hypothetical protein n=1 Tax=Vibrio TaxID=662 RepID=UPI0020751EAF|nr:MULTISPECIES: hypothetical protein [Vibrio]USD35616.1 hypothetical protein J8Z27_22675 [Vibrio sp. SCSIO 43186]USD72740.1 hypothetical protein J4N41_22680 [Vibrio sp. SCSIO 43139]USD98945.1 hypothetical protein CTT30_23005 [Vibrio coralliilyticus]
MDFVTSALLGGALYDLVKSTIKPTAAYVKAALDNLAKLDDNVAAAIAKELDKREFKEAESKEQLAAVIEANTQLMNIINELNAQPKQVINITANGGGDAFYGDKVTGDKIIVNGEDSNK